MNYLQLAYLHLATILPAFAIGTYLLISKKGSPVHKRLGKVYMALMLVTAFITLFIPAEVGSQAIGHFGLIHSFSLLAIVTVPVAYHAARRGNIRLHRSNMVALYIAGILIAGFFAFAPGRLLHQWMF